MTHSKHAVEEGAFANNPGILLAMPEDALELFALAHHASMTSANHSIPVFALSQYALRPYVPAIVRPIYSRAGSTVSDPEHSVHIVAFPDDTGVLLAVAEDALELFALADDSTTAPANNSIPVLALPQYTLRPCVSALLSPLIARLPKGGPVRYSGHVWSRGPAFFRHACKLHLEAIVSKRAVAPYCSRGPRIG